ncbi:hydrogenase nickel incorporation protein HypB [Bellilinea sp.]|jgi:hydrogenase nickel incorporation protein HypB|uniref:hydrogenase nickel incorporation protein HypB n=1 Tax=Bellilinea sp. TaxID=2838785 RepID=UPI002ADDBF1D|nr:hydrogenase nickel incorporation protein HypB [Bellilinea sp.]
MSPTTRIPVVEKIFDANDQVAQQNRSLFDLHHTFAINVMASPGAGKTTFILKTLEGLSSKYRMAVIEGDTAPVTIDSDKVSAMGIPVVQINTGGDCHLDAVMLHAGLQSLPLQDVDIVLIENVGNLICPAAFKLGSHLNLLIASIPEGDDKPYKYPNMYRGLDVLVVNKMDLLPYVDFNMAYFQQGVEILNPGLRTFPVSAKTGEGMQAWYNWLDEVVQKHRQK